MSAAFPFADLRERRRTLIADDKVPKNVFVGPEIGHIAVGTTDYLTTVGAA